MNNFVVLKMLSKFKSTVYLFNYSVHTNVHFNGLLNDAVVIFGLQMYVVCNQKCRPHIVAEKK